jgi:UDP-N-acetylmuramate--alanine ligase
MGTDASMMSGGLSNRFSGNGFAGNFYPGNADLTVFEADESDKSLLAYNPDYSMILNIGVDHFPKDELAEIFSKFLSQTRRGAVIEEDIIALLDPEALKHLEIKTFSVSENSKADWRLSSYHAEKGEVKIGINNSFEIALPMPGVHNAANALAVLAAADLTGCDVSKALKAVSDFKGVWRRFNYAGKLNCGAKVYDDYAHNVQKIISCMRAAREISGGKIIALFQPHGYGPLGFIRDELFAELEKDLSDGDIFGMLPVYYAGGTSSFTPKSDDVISDYITKGKKDYRYFESREKARDFLENTACDGDIVLVMGARDNSLSDWTVKITC